MYNSPAFIKFMGDAIMIAHEKDPDFNYATFLKTALEHDFAYGNIFFDTQTGKLVNPGNIEHGESEKLR